MLLNRHSRPIGNDAVRVNIVGAELVAPVADLVRV
jgi:hypothetical protein